MNRTLRRGLCCLISLLVMLTITSIASAESLDLSSMTDDEILELLSQLNDELVSRGLPKTATLPQGSYIVGEDLPVGTYIYTCLAEGNEWGSFTVYADRGDGDQLEWEIVSAPDEGESPDTIFLRLHENDQLNSPVPFSLTISGGVIFR